MPIANYIEAEALKESLSLTNESFADDDLERAINAASRGIDEATSRHYDSGEEDEVRYYTPASPRLVVIDDLTALAGFDVDVAGDGEFSNGLEQNTDFVLTPLNAAADGVPFTRVKTRRELPCRQRSVRITGTFGWDEVPDQIVEATMILATRLMTRVREAPFGVIPNFEGAAMRIATTDPDVRFLIGPFDRHLRLG